MKILLVTDRANWAYDSIARALIAHNDDPALELDVFHLKGRERELPAVAKRFDGVFVLGWQLLTNLDFLDPARTLTGIHSHHAWDERRTQPGVDVSPPPALIEFLQRYAGVNAVSRRLTDLFRDAGLDDVVYTPNGVDTRLFRPPAATLSLGPLRVGFSGSRKHDWRKGVSEYIEPAAKLAGADVRLAMPGEAGYVPLDSMPQFYSDLDVYVCASSSEGFSLSVLEAAASGRPVISTRVGGCEDLIEDGVNGFLVERDVDAIRSKLEYFASDREALHRMSEASRRVVERDWSWDRRAPAWLDFIRTHLSGD